MRPRIGTRACWLALLWLLLASCHAAAGDEIAGRVEKVVDGDTLDLAVDEDTLRIRLAEIDAPERAQPHGAEATRALAGLVAGKRVRIVETDRDRYGRIVAEIWLGERYVNAELVEAGHAWAYTEYSPDLAIVELEDAARRARRGLWALPAGERDAPWVWRRASRDGSARAVWQRATRGVRCGERLRCSEMADCAEARRHLELCGPSRLDGDGDGVPCEALCRR